MSSDDSTKPDLVPDNVDYDQYSQSSSSPKDTMMRNIRDLSPANTDYMIKPFYNPIKTKDTLIEYSKSENNYDNYNTESSSESDHSNKTTQTEDTKKPQETTLPPAQESKYQSQFNKVNDSAEDAKNKFRQQVGGKVFNSAEEEMLAKYDIMRELGEMAHFQGVKLSQNYTLKSNYEDMLRERNLHKYIKDKHEGTKWLSDAFLHLIKGVEYANNRFDPFGFNLDGWSEHVKGNLNDQYGTFSELYEKYVGQGVNIPPELKLAFAMCSSAAQYHAYNSAIKLLPNLGDEENQALVKELREKAKAEDEGMKAYFNEKHEKANEQLQYLNYIKQREKEQEEENRQNGLYDADSKSEKSVRLQEIQSERERHYRVLEELDRLEANAKQMKSVAGGSTYSRRTDGHSIQAPLPPKRKEVAKTKPAPKKTPQAKEIIEETIESQPTIKPTPLLKKYGKPQVVKPVTQPVATSIAPATINSPPNQIMTRTQPRVPLTTTSPKQQTQQPQQPTQTQTVPQPNATTMLHTIVRNTKASPSLVQINYDPNIKHESFNLLDTETSDRSNIKSSNVSSNKSNSVTSNSTSNSKISSYQSKVSSKSSRSSMSSKVNTPITPISKNTFNNATRIEQYESGQVNVLSDKSSSMKSESSVKSISSMPTQKYQEIIQREKIVRPIKINDTIQIKTKADSGSNSGSSGRRSISSTQFSGGSISTIKSRDGKKRKIISINTKPASQIV